MTNQNPNSSALDTALIDEVANATEEIRVRGSALGGAEQKGAADHTDYEKSRNPDVELRLDEEDGRLYSDGLDIGDDN